MVRDSRNSSDLELPLEFDTSATVAPSRGKPSPEPFPGDTTRVPKVYTYPGVFTPKPVPLHSEPEPIRIGDFSYYLGCNKDLKRVAPTSLSYEHARMALTVCLLIAQRGELREIHAKSKIFSIAVRTTWRELARLFQYTAAPGASSIKKFERWLTELRAFPFAVKYKDEKVMTSFFIENHVIVKMKTNSPEDGTVLIQVSEAFFNFLSDISHSHDIRIDQFLSIEGRIAGLLYLWLPAMTYRSVKQGKVYEIDAVDALRRIGMDPPRSSRGQIFPSKVKQIFEQHGEKSVIRQLQGRATRTGYWKRVWLAQSDEPKSCGVKLCIEEVRTQEDRAPVLGNPRISSTSLGILRSYFLTGKIGRTEGDYLQRRMDLRDYIRKTGCEFSDYERELLDYLEIKAEVFRKNRSCLLEIKALLGSDGLERVLADVVSQIREGKTATASNLQWVIDTAKAYLNPERHETEHRHRFASV